MSNETEKNGEMTSGSFSILADPNKRIPKYCTSVLFSKLNNGHVIMTFLQKDFTADDKERSLNGSVLIERVFFDKEHFNKVYDALKKIAEEPDESNV